LRALRCRGPIAPTRTIRFHATCTTSPITRFTSSRSTGAPYFC